jgi:hypothetical protein
VIINTSRAGLFQECRVKAENWHIKRLVSWREADPLMIGEAFHVGVAHFYAKGSVQESVALAESTFRKRLEGQMILTEEKELIERNITFSKRAIEKYAEHWKDEPIQILMPEVKFRVELPNTHHHCWFVHKLLHSEGISPFEHCQDPRCWIPHYFTGRTDAVVSWRNMIWLLEHKTAAQTGQLFFDKFTLDQQTTGYIYGIWKHTSVRPHGFILNVIKKPYKNASDPFAITFEREAYIRDDESLKEFETELIRIANNYELAMRTGDIYKNSKSCISFQRRCYYFDLCARHNQEQEGEFRPRSPDYVDLEYYNILGIPIPEKEATSLVITQDMPDPS